MNRKDRRTQKSQKGYTASPELLGLLGQAMQFHQTGNLQQAEQIYRQVLIIEPRHPESLHYLGLIAYQVGRPDIAEGLMKQAIEVDGKQSMFHNNLGLALYQQHKFDEAVASFKHTLALAPKDSEAYNNLGAVLEAQGKIDEALKVYQKALTINSSYANAHYNVGNALRKLDRLDEAAASYREALKLNPTYAEAGNNLGAVLKDQGKLAEAAACFEDTLAVKPDHAEACVNLATVYQEFGRVEEAVQQCRRALEIRPDYVDALNNLGLALVELEEFDEAITHYHRAVALAPHQVESYNNLGAALEHQDKFAEAMAVYQQALTLRPDVPEVHFNLGNLARKEERFDDAARHYNQAIALRPDYIEAHWNLSVISLLKGDFATGWHESEWRWRRKGIPPHGYAGPMWDGGDLTGKTILLHSEQGLGDSIQFVRYAAIAKQKGGTVLLSCPPALAELMKTVPGVDKVFIRKSEIPAYDCHVPLMSLPGILGTNLTNIPADVPYIHAGPARAAIWRDRLAASCPGLKVGIVWRGNPDHKNDHNRSSTPAHYAVFLDAPGISVINLQKDAREDELKALSIKGPFLNAGPELNDFADTAALVSQLDLIISVDTSVCHLAGALGRPTWTLIAYEPDWRWLLERTDSPWYPSMRLFRQSKTGDWPGVMSDVKMALLAL